jgi:hypothetical protein
VYEMLQELSDREQEIRNQLSAVLQQKSCLKARKSELKSVVRQSMYSVGPTKPEGQPKKVTRKVEDSSLPSTEG